MAVENAESLSQGVNLPSFIPLSRRGVISSRRARIITKNFFLDVNVNK
jgi:hypothetical protein